MRYLVLMSAFLLAGCGKDRDGGGHLGTGPGRTEATPKAAGKPVKQIRKKPIVEQEEEYPRVGPIELGEAYDRNPAAADKKYKGKTIEIEMPWTMERWGEETVVRTGRRVYRFVSEGEAAKVESGTFYLVRGRCDGLVGGNIVISSVRILGILHSN